ncbi:MAG: molybdopterin-dependent oxidoreductase [Pseudomonadota bacterium]
MPDDGARLGSPFSDEVADTTSDIAAEQVVGTRTTCPYCGVGCGVIVSPSQDGLTAAVKGDPDHPANFGRLCSKGAALGETLSLDQRLLTPQINGAPAAWSSALAHVASAFQNAIAAHGPDSVAMYVSGQILTEDYYVANKLMKGFIGTANIDTNSRLCMASSVAGHKRAFGSDTVPGTYEDLECADLVVLVGSNLAWCHPVLYQRLVAARRERGTRVVVIDPRATATCEDADVHLAIAPGSDVALFNGLLVHLIDHGAMADAYVANHTQGLENALRAARELSLEDVAGATGLQAQSLEEFYRLFAETERVVTVYSQGVNQSASGTDKVNAIINCHLATGRIGRPGMGPFSVTGQPNAMGGREVGGLANMLAAHMELANPEHRDLVQRLWSAPTIADKPGLKAVDLFEAVGDGRIKALWIMATNPVDSLPDADRVRAAIDACPFVVVSDVTSATDTAVLADVLLPSTAWGEKDGTVTNSERRISRQRAFLPPPGEARADWWQICEVAKRLGHEPAFSYGGPAEIFAEYAALTGTENDGRRDLDLSALALIGRAEYDALEPVQWPQIAGRTRTHLQAETRFFANGGFYTPDHRARIVATPYRPPAVPLTSAFPLVLNTGRIRDQWHTMTRTAKAPRLLTHIAEPFLDMHPSDARNLGITAADLVRVESAHGTMIARVVLSDRQRAGSVFAPMHWTDQYASHGRVDALVAPRTDPVSGQPESKYTPVRVTRFDARWYAFVVTSRTLNPSDFDYAAIAPTREGTRAELAGLGDLENWHAFAQQILSPAGEHDRTVELIGYADQTTGQYRFAAVRDKRCVGLLFAARAPVAVSRTWATSMLGVELSPSERLHLLAGRPAADQPDPGTIVCACFHVGINQIIGSITDGGCTSVDAVGDATCAGTNCGSCRAEIGRLLHDARSEKAKVHAAE